MTIPHDSFDGLGIAPKILDMLTRLRFTVPTPIQKKAIPLAIEGKDVVGIAQTGTGKTLSFALPMVQRLAQVKGRGLILAPTRELALQIDSVYQKLAPQFGMKTAVIIGGASQQQQVFALRKHPRIIIATPGRLIDLMDQRQVMLQDISMLVLDEADRMFDMGFQPQIEKIIRAIPRERQTMLFSATMPKEIMDMAAKHMKLPVSVEIAPSGTTAADVAQEIFIVKKEAKLRLLEKLLGQYHGAVLLFSRTKHNATKIAKAIRQMGHTAADIHSNRSLAQRREALEGFKRGKYKVLAATDIAARGIDVVGIELVINYDLPDDANNYVHRIGRTGRAGHKGIAISFAMPEQARDVKNIERCIGRTIPISRHPDLAPTEFYSHAQHQGHQRHRHHSSSARFRTESKGPRKSGPGSAEGRGGYGSTAAGPRRHSAGRDAQQGGHRPFRHHGEGHRQFHRGPRQQ